MKKSTLNKRLLAAAMLSMLTLGFNSTNAMAATDDGNESETTLKQGKVVHLSGFGDADENGLPKGWTLKFVESYSSPLVNQLSPELSAEYAKTVSYGDFDNPLIHTKAFRGSPKAVTVLERVYSLEELGLTEKDILDTEIGIRAGVQVIGLNQVKDVNKCEQVKVLLSAYDSDGGLIAAEDNGTELAGIFASNHLESVIDFGGENGDSGDIKVKVSIIIKPNAEFTDVPGSAIGNVDIYQSPMNMVGSPKYIATGYNGHGDVYGDGFYLPFATEDTKVELYAVNKDSDIYPNTMWRNKDGEIVSHGEKCEVTLNDSDDDIIDPTYWPYPTRTTKYYAVVYDKLTSIKAIADGNGTISPKGVDGVVEYGPDESPTYKAYPNGERSLFAGWRDANGNILSSNSEYSFHIDDQPELPITAKFQDLTDCTYTTDALWSTVYYRDLIDLSKYASDIRLFKVKGKASDGSNALELSEKIGTGVDPYTPVLVYNPNRETISLPLFTCKKPFDEGKIAGYEDGYLKGTLDLDGATVPAGAYALGCKDGKYGFYRVDAAGSASVDAFNCWLELPASIAGGNTEFMLPDNISTGIKSVETTTGTNVSAPKSVYTLDGKKVETQQPGQLYIVDGKKIVK